MYLFEMLTENQNIINNEPSEKTKISFCSFAERGIEPCREGVGEGERSEWKHLSISPCPLCHHSHHSVHNHGSR